MKNLTQKTIEEIKSHANEIYPEECCGVVVRKGRKQIVVRAENEHPDDKTKYFKIPAQTYKDCVKKYDEIIAIYHSHPDGPGNFTYHDIAVSEVLEVPIIMMEWPKGNYIFHSPKQGGNIPYTQRPFILGILDCYTLMRDYFRRELTIELPALQVPYEWWKKGENLYLDNIEKFARRIPGIKDLKKNDVILMCIEADVPEHGAIYTGDGKILHHMMGKLSRHSVYSRFYQERTHSIWRHNEL